MRIDRIGRHPQHIPALAAWHHAEWGALYDDWTLDAAASELADHVWIMDAGRIDVDGPVDALTREASLEDVFLRHTKGHP